MIKTLKVLQLQKITVVIFLCLICIFNEGFSFAQNKVQRINDLIFSYNKNSYFNGAVLVAEHGKVICKNAIGIADFEKNIPLSIESKFPVYSISKQFTSMCMMMLVEEGKISLNGKLSDYLPYYRKDTGSKIRIRNLLSHTHGISVPDVENVPMEQVIPIDEYVRTYISEDFEFEPGTNFKYGMGHGLIISTAIVKQLSGKHFEDFLKEKILNPLNMKNTGYLHNDKVIIQFHQSEDI